MSLPGCLFHVQRFVSLLLCSANSVCLVSCVVAGTERPRNGRKIAEREETHAFFNKSKHHRAIETHPASQIISPVGVFYQKKCLITRSSDTGVSWKKVLRSIWSMLHLEEREKKGFTSSLKMVVTSSVLSKTWKGLKSERVLKMEGHTNGSWRVIWFLLD